MLPSSSGLPPSLKREVAVSYETLELMYQTTRRHISEGHDIDKYMDTHSLRNQTKDESLLHVIATDKQGPNFTSSIKTVTRVVWYP
jgi:hypothetical protein